MSPITECIMKNLLEEPFFKDFKWRKRDCSLIRKTEWGQQWVRFQRWNEMILLSIVPHYYVRFDIATKWFSKYDPRDPKDKRDDCTFGFSGYMLNSTEDFYFYYESCAEELGKPDFVEQYLNLRDVVLKNSQYVFDTYSSLENAYKAAIVPILDGEAQMTENVRMIFYYLKLCSIVEPGKYQELKKYALETFEDLHKTKEVNFEIRYYHQVDAIFADIESGM